MTPEVFGTLLEKSLSVAVLLFVVLYFMKQIDKKDALHNEITKEFIGIAKESNQVHIESKNAITTMSSKIEALNSDMNQGRFCKGTTRKA